MWVPLEVIDFASDCISHGVKAVSLGGGEPFEYEGVFDVIDALYSKCYLSVTSNGLPIENPQIWKMLTEHKPDKIHLTIHHPDDESEIRRIERQLQCIGQIGIKPGLLKTDDIHPPKSVISVHFFCLTCLMALQI